MTDDDIRAIEERAAKATPGPWERGDQIREPFAGLEDQHNVFPPLGEVGPIAEVCGAENASFIAAARTDVPALCAELRAARSYLEVVRGLVASAQQAHDEMRSERDEQRARVAELEAEREIMRAHWTCLREDVDAAIRHREQKGGQQAGIPNLANAPPSLLVYLARAARDALGVEP